jgi:hypothetical protein
MVLLKHLLFLTIQSVIKLGPGIVVAWSTQFWSNSKMMMKWMCSTCRDPTEGDVSVSGTCT